MSEAASGQTTRLTLKPERSMLIAEVRTNTHPFRATASGVRGHIEGEMFADGRCNLAAPYRAKLELPVRNIESGNRLRDLELHRRFESDRYPNVLVNLKQAWTLQHDGAYRALVDINARGRIASMEVDLRMMVEGPRLIVEVEREVDMRDFGISPPRFFWARIEPVIRVRLRLVAEGVAA